jgi:hypothetical protein
MLFFVDESWQTISGQRVAALGAVAIPAGGYNPFCREFFALKRDILGATELSHSEIRGQKMFSKAAFKRQELYGDSHWIAAADALFKLLKRHHAHTFVIWTTNPDYVSLRTTQTTALPKPYKQLLFDFRAFLSREAKGRLGSINFDQRGMKEDEVAACTVANFLVRTNAAWDRHVTQIPNFTVSSVSPGLQSADTMAHLGAHLADLDERPELVPYVDAMRDLQYAWKWGTKNRRTIRQVL